MSREPNHQASNYWLEIAIRDLTMGTYGMVLYQVNTIHLKHILRQRLSFLCQSENRSIYLKIMNKAMKTLRYLNTLS